MAELIPSTADEPRSIRLGLIGLGAIALTHASALRALPLTTRSRLRPTIAAAFSSRGSDAKLDAERVCAEHLLSLDELLNDPTIEAVDITSRTDAHASHLTQVVSAGKHVYVEKPIASSREALTRLATLRMPPGQVNQVGLVMRYHRAVIESRCLISCGAIGSVSHARIGILRGGYLDPARAMSWKLRPESGGGVVLDLGVHALDLAKHLIGPLTLSAASCRTVVPERSTAGGETETVKVEDWAWCELGSASAHVTVEVSRVALGATSIFIHVFGSEGSITMDLLRDAQPELVRLDGRESDYRLTARASSTFREAMKLMPPEALTLGWFTDAHLAALHHFLLRVTGSDPLPGYSPTVKDAIEVETLVWATLDRCGRG